jgi:peptidoglycan/xylan/chitin deacetylase (PgdA/CDA1 family)
MAPRWSWDFEDDRRAAPAPSKPGPPGPPSGGPPHEPRPGRRAVQIRRRRLAAALLLAVVVVLAVIATAGSSGGNHKRPATARTGPSVARAAKPPQTEQDALAAVRSVLAYTPFVKQGSARVRDIALTFDDGPGPYTIELLKVLERYRVKATFFVIGKMLQYFSPATEREIRDGDVIGDHTETHPFMATLSAHDQYEELFEQLARIELLGGRRPTLFRPPYGSFNATTMKELAKLHLLMVLWSVDTEDYLQPGVSVIVERALAGAHPGAIILMHDAGGTRTQTIEALPLIVTKLRAEGYHLVTIPRLLLDDPPPHGEPLPPNLSGD